MKTMHPGAFLLTQVIEPLGLDIGQTALILGVPRPALSALLQGEAPLDPEMAWRWEKAFDIGVDGMLRMQATYDAAQIRRKAPELGVTPYIPPQTQAKATEMGGLHRQWQPDQAPPER